jgi:hypothetical protein
MCTHHPKKQVSFATIEILEFPIMLGDNPSVITSGPPLPTSWEPQFRMEMDLDVFEMNRPRRRCPQDLIIDSGTREQDVLIRSVVGITTIPADEEDQHSTTTTSNQW